jgi:hypothetical protein
MRMSDRWTLEARGWTEGGAGVAAGGGAEGGTAADASERVGEEAWDTPLPPGGFVQGFDSMGVTSRGDARM